MELSLRLDTLGMVEVRYLRGSSFLPRLPFLPPPFPPCFSPCHLTRNPALTVVPTDDEL